MKKNFLFTTVITCCFLLTAWTPPTLTKEQMYEDFDEFLFILENANPQLPIRKSVTGVGILDSIKALRTRIDTIQNYFDFIKLFDYSMRYMYDIHAFIEKQGCHQWDDTIGIDTKIINEIYTEYDKWLKEQSAKKGQTEHSYFPCNPSYLDGNYYLYGYYILTSKDKNDTLFIKNAKIISYNNSPYNDYVLRNSHRFFGGSIRWDFKQNKYYCNSSAFLRNSELVLENEDGKIFSLNPSAYYGIDVITQRCDATLNQNADFKFYKQTYKRENRVFYLEKDKILYVYLPDMNDPEYQTAEKVKEIGKGKEINKVIFDVRGNLGGSDFVWHNVLKSIVADSLIYDVQMAFLNTDLMRQRLDNHANITKVQKFEWLPNTEYLVTQYAPSYFVPDHNSLNYKGKIYVLQDENVYSAGHSLTSYCRHIEQLISVGEPTGLLAGFGLMPMLFQLKHSKFSFRIEPVIDVTKVNSALDVYQDFPEIVVEFPFEEKRKYLDYKNFDMQNENNLYKYDYLFKKVLELK